MDFPEPPKFLENLTRKRITALCVRHQHDRIRFLICDFGRICDVEETLKSNGGSSLEFSFVFSMYHLSLRCSRKDRAFSHIRQKVLVILHVYHNFVEVLSRKRQHLWCFIFYWSLLSHKRLKEASIWNRANRHTHAIEIWIKASALTKLHYFQSTLSTCTKL